MIFKHRNSCFSTDKQDVAYEVKSNVPNKTNWLKQAKKRKVMYNLTLPKYNYLILHCFNKQPLALLFSQNTLRYQRNVCN